MNGIYPMSPYIGTISIKTMHATIVLPVLHPNRRDTMGHKVAPAIPEAVAVIDSNAIATVLNLNSIRAKIIAVPLTVAIASDRRNHAARNVMVCRNWIATLIVFHTDCQANLVYSRASRKVPPRLDIVGNGGPGRGRSQRAAGTVNASHITPARTRTRRSGNVFDVVVEPNLLTRKRSRMLRHWPDTAAQ